MRFLSLNCFFILSLANAIVDDNKIFTQNTQLDSSYANITSAPIDEEELTWGQIRGGNEQNPITLSAQDLRISAIHHKTGGATGLHITHKSHGRLNGNFSFTSISSDMDAIGIRGGGAESLENIGALTFDHIFSSSYLASGIFASNLIQKGTLRIKNIEAPKGYGVGIFAFSLHNEERAKITIETITARNAVGIAGLMTFNSGRIELQNIRAEEEAVGLENIQNHGTILIDSVIGMQRAVGLEMGIENTNEFFPNPQVTINKIYSNGEAIGSKYKIENYGGTILFREIKGKRLALGTSNAFNSGRLDFGSIASDGVAIGIHGRVDGVGRMRFGEIKAPKAIGLYGDGWLNTSGSLIFESIIGTESYGILIDKDTLSNFDREDKPFLHFKSIQSGVGINNIAGYFDISGKPRFVFGPNAPKIQATLYNEMPQGKFYLNHSNIDSAYPYAFYAQEEAHIHINASLSQWNAREYSFGGKTNLHLQEGATLSLQTGGTLQSLHADRAQINLSDRGHSQRLGIQNFQAQNSNFTMGVSLDTAQSSSYDGGGFYENQSQIQTGSTAFLQIDSTNTARQLNNTLSIDLKTKNNSSQKYILLAQVSGTNRDNITFNSLADRQAVAIAPSSGYKTDALLLGRYDDAGTQTNYYFLVANPYTAQDLPPQIPETPKPPSTPIPQAPQDEQSKISTIYNPSQSVLLATFDWSEMRFAKLRNDVRTSRIWSEFRTQYWKYNADPNCDETFVHWMLGGDYLLSFAQGRNAVGVAIEVSGNFIDQTQAIPTKHHPRYETLDINSTFLTLVFYDILMLDNGIYSNTSFKVGGGSGEIVRESVWHSKNSEDSAMIYSLSEQIGKRMFISQKNGLFVDFSATLALGYAEQMSLAQEISTAPWDKSNFLSIASTPSFINQNKLTILLGYQGKPNSFLSFDLNAGFGLVSNHCIGGEMRYENQDETFTSKNIPYASGLELKANGRFRLGNWVDTYLSLSSTWGKRYNEIIDFSAGIKLRFGTA